MSFTMGLSVDSTTTERERERVVEYIILINERVQSQQISLSQSLSPLLLLDFFHGALPIILEDT